MRKTHRMNTGQRSRGLSLVEILVASAIGLIASVAIFQVFAVFEGQKRTTTTGGEAQINGALALFTIERDVRMAGYGINNLAFLGCTINGWDEQTGGGTAFTLTLAPVVITDGAAGAPDQIAVLYGSGEFLPNPATLTAAMPSPAAVYRVNNRYGFQEGDLVVVAQAGQPCTLAQVSGLPGTPGNTDNVIHGSGTYTDPNSGAQVATRYNRPGGLPPPNNISYGIGARLFNLGSLPNDNIYSVQADRLMLLQQLSGPPTLAPQAIFEGIVQLQAQYGKDTGVHAGHVASDNVVDTWDEIPPANQAAWAQVLAIRIALVARSSQPEKPDPDGVCRTTTATSANRPRWAAGNINVAADPQWQCYRYKTFKTTVPLRNMIWTP